MKKYSLFLLCLMAAISLHAQSFADYFADKTLRVDYIFTGNAAKQEICLDGLSCLPSWAGRKHHLSELPLQGNGQIIMRDAANGSVIYKTSFSSLFQDQRIRKHLSPSLSPPSCRNRNNTSRPA